MKKLIFLMLAFTGCTAPKEIAKTNNFDLKTFAVRHQLTFVATTASAFETRPVVNQPNGLVLVLTNAANADEVNQAFVLQEASGLTFSSKTIEIAYNDKGALLQTDGQLYGLRMSEYKGFFSELKTPFKLIEGVGWARYDFQAPRKPFLEVMKKEGFLAAYEGARR